jgi:hypothetical protein
MADSPGGERQKRIAGHSESIGPSGERVESGAAFLKGSFSIEQTDGRGSLRIETDEAFVALAVPVERDSGFLCGHGYARRQYRNQLP